MHSYSEFFPHRSPDDELDCVPLIMAGLRGAPHTTLLCIDGLAISRAEVVARVGRLQQWLAARGLVKGDRVALMLGNHAEHIYLIYALLLSGLVWVPVNTRLRKAGLDYVIEHAGPALFIAEPLFDDVLAEVAPGTVPRIELPQLVLQAARYPHGAPRAVALAHDDPLCIMYTSGTTGAPKGVVFTHRMMRIAGEAVMLVADVRPGDRLFLWEPLCHIGGAQMLLMPFFEAVELHVVPGFSATAFWSQIARAGATQVHYLGGILDILMQLPPQAAPHAHTLRAAWGAGVGVAAWQATRERLGLELRECYGMTECSSFATLNTSGKPGSIGRPLPWITVELLDDQGAPVIPDETTRTGEIVLSSPVDGVFLPAYLENPEATHQALRAGKLHTGDSARRDLDGDLFFVGRRTDSMRVRGENVSAWEIERVFAAHPAIRTTAAVGVETLIGEQDIMLYVQFEDAVSPSGSTPTWSELHSWAAQRLAAFQLPRYYQAIAQFELTPSERVRKHLLPRSVQDAWNSGLAGTGPRAGRGTVAKKRDEKQPGKQDEKHREEAARNDPSRPIA
jgi:crotonobetaine/carnitine-CoA ligase